MMNTSNQIIEKYVHSVISTSNHLVEQFPQLDTSFLTMSQKWGDIYLPAFAVVHLGNFPLCYKEWQKDKILPAVNFRMEMEKSGIKINILADDFLTENNHYWKYLWNHLINSFNLDKIDGRNSESYYQKIVYYFLRDRKAISNNSFRYIDLRPTVPNVLSELVVAKIGFLKTIFNAGLFLVMEAESWTARIPEKKDPFIIGIHYDYEYKLFQSYLASVFDPTIKENFCLKEFIEGV